MQPLSMLKDIRLGIDGNVWLKKIIQASSEQYLAGIGGTPSCLRKAIEKELEGFKYVIQLQLYRPIAYRSVLSPFIKKQLLACLPISFQGCLNSPALRLLRTRLDP